MKREQSRAARNKPAQASPINSLQRANFLYRVALQHQQTGQPSEAEKVCWENITAHPSHADSLHLLSLIALQTERKELAIELIGKAIISHPQCSSFHYTAGFIFHASARVPEAIKCYKKAITLDANAFDAHVALASAYFEQQRLDDAALTCEQAIRIRPDHAAVFFLLGNVFQLQDRLEDAIAQYRRALELNPNISELHNNLGSALRQQGKIADAIAHFREAIALKGDNPEAWNNLGLGLQQQTLLADAIDCYKRALALKPNFVAALQNLSSVLLTQGQVDLALAHALRALEISDTSEIKALFVRCAGVIGERHFIPQPDKVEQIVTQALSEPWGRPSDLAYLTSRLLRLNQGLEVHVEQAVAAPVAHVVLASLSPAVYESRLLRTWLLAAPVSNLRLERFLTGARRAILETAMAGQPRNSHHPLFIEFAAALAQQCFINEYVFWCEDDEWVKANRLRDLLLEALNSKATVPDVWIAAVAAYFPLYSLPFELPGERAWCDAVSAIIVQQVLEPRCERACRTKIPRLTELAGELSFTVQRQYEENPYPRWIKTSVLAPTTLGKLLRSLFPHVSFPDFEQKLGANILIAGCGTGQQAIETAMRFPRARVLAVDISLASLCYASRKTFEAGLNNVQYAQADILRLNSPDLKFDLIEATGVLHHLEDPLAGWSSLLRILRTDGVMRIGLYSSMARREIVEAQEIALQRRVQTDRYRYPQI